LERQLTRTTERNTRAATARVFVVSAPMFGDQALCTPAVVKLLAQEGTPLRPQAVTDDGVRGEANREAQPLCANAEVHVFCADGTKRFVEATDRVKGGSPKPEGGANSIRNTAPHRKLRHLGAHTRPDETVEVK
jgi:hypothetical protein